MESTVPTLQNKAAFEEALRNYRISDHGRQVLADTPFVALSSVAGGGRNTVIRILVEKYNYIFAVSDTTRPPKFRDGRMEEDGVNYYFRNETDMLHDIQSGEFIEAELIHNQQVSGTSIREAERAKATKKIPIRDFEYKGIGNIVLAKPDATIIGLVPPSYDEWIRRLYNREALHDEEFANRLVTAEKVLENMLDKPYFHLVINNTADQCANDIRKIVEFHNYSPEDEQRVREVVVELLKRVRQELATRTP